MEQSTEQSQENAKNALDDLQTHEPAMEVNAAEEEMPEVSDRIYLKSPFRETHVEMLVVGKKEEKNSSTGSDETCYTFQDGSKLFESDLTGGGYSWAPVPTTPSGIDDLQRNDETEED